MNPDTDPKDVKKMKLLAVVSWFGTKCELCRQQDVSPDCRLCQACGEAIVRLVAIRERNREEYLYEAERDRQTNDKKVAVRGFTPFWA